MKNLKLLLFVLCISFLIQFSSCTSNNTEQVAVIDSLKTELENAKNIVATISEDKNKELQFIVDSNISYFSKNYKDSLSKQVGFMFQDYKVVSKEIKKYNQIKDQLKLNIDYSITQLEKLKADLTSTKITKEQFAEFIVTERKECVKLIDLAKERQKTLNFEYHKFDSLNPLIIEFIKNIKIK
ncbi:MAG: hypothetical protein V4667_02440 [Bacteroidota bacterium]